MVGFRSNQPPPLYFMHDNSKPGRVVRRNRVVHREGTPMRHNHTDSWPTSVIEDHELIALDTSTLNVQPWIMGMEGTDFEGRTWVTWFSTFERNCHLCGESVNSGWNQHESQVWICRKHFNIEGKH